MGTWPFTGRHGCQHNLCVDTLEVESNLPCNAKYKSNGTQSLFERRELVSVAV
ncbi:hypothetical protein Q9233_010623 [Columba guinea]|nr:hypothetical protein Q9233_010623 [Columba guinea]